MPRSKPAQPRSRKLTSKPGKKEHSSPRPEPIEGEAHKQFSTDSQSIHSSYSESRLERFAVKASAITSPHKNMPRRRGLNRAILAEKKIKDKSDSKRTPRLCRTGSVDGDNFPRDESFDTSDCKSSAGSESGNDDSSESVTPTRRSNRQRLPKPVNFSHEDEALEKHSPRKRRLERRLLAKQRKPMGKSSDQDNVLTSESIHKRRRPMVRKSIKSAFPAIGESTRKALKNVTLLGQSNVDASVPPQARRRSTKRTQNEDEDDFVVTSGDEEEGEDMNHTQSDDSEDLLSSDNSDHFQTQSNHGVHHVESDGIGSADESSGTEENETAIYSSPQLTFISRGDTSVKPSPFHDSTDDNSDDSSNQRHRLSPPKLPNCTSRRDTITDEPLPEKHVCFFSPDMESRQCFCLATLRKIALSASRPKYRTDQTGTERQTFLQPPHFRTAMSDDLLDQIASRFGREALDLYGSFYVQRNTRDIAEKEDAGTFEERSQQDEEGFLNLVRTTDGLLQRYIKNTSYRTFQGQLKNYWFDGNNESFVYLLSLLHKAGRARELVKQQDHSDFDDACQYIEPAVKFFHSFADHALELWDLISGPYARDDEEDMGDFLDESNADDSDGGHRALAMEEARQEMEIDQHLIERYTQLEETESDRSVDTYESDVANGGVFEESSEEEDEWEQAIKDRRASFGARSDRAKLASGRKSSDTGELERGHRLHKKAMKDSSSDEEFKAADSQLNVRALRSGLTPRRLAIEDSEDE
ncbi:predicted protein [Phaeodactylum tricornutum CCAP 1055/1]|uniref:Uncharacterized protein n=2 Tax=Phaeodactylum tricornutum TaxID=2850 RepID=B5Y3A7_PHATC|nr:predicted protein [Phaeodactylum tricornutum CCAP 1055/1]ACI65284.1 predicted protein [Phaeodactylum tricornutum CCAP 1055/1]|eukprot:XP_002185814.1 predicted protein [Phaeodactylum tricornutum CCAP 1055/1]